MSTQRTWSGRRTRPDLSLSLTPRAVAALGLLGAAAIFGTATVASKAVFDHVPPLTLACSRFGIAGVALLILCLRAGQRPEFSRRTAALGTSGIALVYACQNLGLLSIGAGNSVVIIEGTIPIATAIFGAWLLGERFGPSRLAGLLVAVVGVGAIALSSADGEFSATGVALSVAAAVSYSASTVAGRRIFQGGSLLPVLTGSTAFAVLFLLPAAAVEVAVVGIGPVTPSDVLLMLFLGLAGSAVAQILWANGLSRMEASEVAVFGTLMPVVGLVAATVFLAEPIGLPQAIGVLLVGIGLLLTTGARFPTPTWGQVRRAGVAHGAGIAAGWFAIAWLRLEPTPARVSASESTSAARPTMRVVSTWSPFPGLVRLPVPTILVLDEPTRPGAEVVPPQRHADAFESTTSGAELGADSAA